MRALEYLAQLFPDKTGKELIEIQNQDKLDDKLEFEKLHRKQLDIIEDINTNGGYYRGRFGLDQHFYYSFSNLYLNGGDILCNVLSLVAFYQEDNKIKIEYRKEIYRNFDNFTVQYIEKITKEEFDLVEKLLTEFKEKLWSK